MSDLCCLLSGPALSPALIAALDEARPHLCVDSGFGMVPVDAPSATIAEAASRFGRDDSVVFYGWEPSFPDIARRASAEHARLARFCKDKAASRRLTGDLLPDFRCIELKADELSSFSPQTDRAPVVLKPSVGTNSIGVRVVTSAAEWTAAVAGARADIAQAAQRIGADVLSGETFLIEDYIEGAEYACDGFWDKDGRPAIVGIYEHPFGSTKDVADVIYLTSRPIMQALLHDTKDLLERIGARFQARRFAFHLEFRRRRDGLLVPLELNPLRFGQTGFSDLAFHAFGHNPYLHFFMDKEPDWSSLEDGDDRICALVVGLARAESDREPQMAAFLAEVGDCVGHVAADRQPSPFLGLAFTRLASRDGIPRLLSVQQNLATSIPFGQR